MHRPPRVLRTLSILPALVLALPAGSHAQCEVEQQEIVPPDGESGDVFGYRVARMGDVAAVAATFDDDLGVDSGSAYVYLRDSTAGWKLQKKLLASDGQAGDSFAYSLAVDGKYVIVGAPLHDGDAQDRGAVYVFFRDQGGPGNWGEVASFVPASAGPGAWFGQSLAVDGDRLLVGAPHPGMPVPGRAYLYRGDPGSASGWTLERELLAGDPATGFSFGNAVALSGDRLAVSGSTTSTLPFSSAYVAHVFERDAGGPGNWGQVQSIASESGFGDYFAYRIALSGDLLAVVAPGEFDPATNRIGALYLYRRDQGGPGQWGRLRRIPPPGTAQAIFAPEQVELAGDWLVAGSPAEDESGAVFVFGRDVGGPGAWGAVARLKADLEPGAGLGQGLALEGDELLAGAAGRYEGAEAGEVYALDLSRLARSVWRSDARGANIDSLRASAPVLGSAVTAQVDLRTTHHAFAVLLVLASATESVLPGGQVLLGGQRLLAVAAPGPVADFVLPVPADPGLCGRVVTLQAAHVGAVQPFALSNAQDLVLGFE